MKLRLCRVGFHRDVKIQVDESVKTRHRGEEMVLLEIGNVDSYGREHWTGVVSKQINNVDVVKRNIEMLERIDPEDRLAWFKLNFPRADIVKIEASHIVDRVNAPMKDTIDHTAAVTIESAVDVVWG